ncbi:MAG: hypothetical protein GEU94_03190 [Micromonosporaceae bacterium]|nr:hypothetical protein [Micromonosporaceae bacterium]
MHYWDANDADVQDFDGGARGPVMFVDSGQGGFFVFADFRQVYLDGAAYDCGVPVSDEYDTEDGTRQGFATCYMTWTEEGGVVVYEN